MKKSETVEDLVSQLVKKIVIDIKRETKTIPGVLDILVSCDMKNGETVVKICAGLSDGK